MYMGESVKWDVEQSRYRKVEQKFHCQCTVRLGCTACSSVCKFLFAVCRVNHMGENEKSI